MINAGHIIRPSVASIICTPNDAGRREYRLRTPEMRCGKRSAKTFFGAKVIKIGRRPGVSIQLTTLNTSSPGGRRRTEGGGALYAGARAMLRKVV